MAQLDLQPKGEELKTRAELEDLVSFSKHLFPGPRLALAVWFGRSPGSTEHNILELFAGAPMSKIYPYPPLSLHWKEGLNDPPFARLFVTSVDYFTKLLVQSDPQLAQYFERPEVLYFSKDTLNEQVIRRFNIITEPAGLIKGWYVSADERAQSRTLRNMLASQGHMGPHVGLVKTEESADFENCRGLLHVEVEQRWLPLSEGGLQSYTFYNDWLDGRSGYFLFEGGALYHILRFEVKTAPEYSDRVLEKPREDRYAEVYLRAMHPPEQPAA